MPEHWNQRGNTEKSSRCARTRVSWMILMLLVTAHVATAKPTRGTLELVSVTSPVIVNNQIFSEATGIVAVTVGHTGTPAQYFITVSRGGSSTFDPRRMEYRFFFGILATYLDYNIFTPSGQIARDLTGPVTTPEVVHGNFGNTGSGYATATRTFDLQIPAGQLVRRGTYRDEVTVSLYKGRPSQAESAVLIDQEVVEVSSTTATIAQIAISGEAQHTMDFGFLTEGAVRTADLLYRTNAAYRIDAASENNGVMVNVYQSQSDPIPYQLHVDGSPVDLSTPTLVRLGLFSAGSAESFDSLPLAVAIGSVADVLPGRFEDVITFTISTF